MPYITTDRRREINVGKLPATPGELNYAITKLVHRYLIVTKGGMGYANANEVIGVLECAKLEVYRVLLAPYEDRKKAETGPVSELDGLDPDPNA